MFKRLNSLEDYYDLLGCKNNYSVKQVQCEICANKTFETICTHTDTGNKILAPVPVQSCQKCGFLMQNPRFPEEFYNRYYDEFYPYMRARSQSNVEGDPNNVGGKKQMSEDGTPNDFGFEVAMDRARNLYNYMQEKNIQVPNKSLLDVGCGCGGFMKFFSEKGYETFGNDPDIKAAKFGIKKGMVIDTIPGEKMDYKRKFGLIIIIGSLEHCFDPNVILKKCWEMLEEEGVIVIEGRYYPISESFRWLNSNHHRFFTHESSQAIYLKHGFEIIESTTNPVCGGNTGRNGGGFAFGKKISSNKRYLNVEDEETQRILLDQLSKNELLITPNQIKNDISKHDKKFNIEYIK